MPRSSGSRGNPVLVVLPLLALALGCQGRSTPDRPASPVLSIAPDRTATAAGVYLPGESATVRDKHGPLLMLTVTLLKVSSQAPDAYSEKPAHGFFVTVRVSATAVAGGQSLSPTDFHARSHDGADYAAGSGNADQVDDSHELIAALPAKNETVGGDLTFDVPSPHVLVEYVPAGQTLAGWQL